MARMDRKSFHAPITPETYDVLREESEARGIPATTLVREATRNWIDDQKAKQLQDEIAAYALEMAEKGADLDPDLEKAAAAELNDQPAGAGGLGKARSALCHKVTTLDRAKLTRRIGSLSPADLDRLSAGLMAALELG